MTPEERFWAKVDKSGDCWLWTASKDTNGYGQFWIKGATHPWKAPRAAFLFWYGVDPGPMHVLHKCDNPACVRPDHLFLGTHRDNMQDAKSKGRMRLYHERGEKNSHAKLTDGQVRQIRELYAHRRHTQIELAKIFGVAQTHISRIVRNEIRPGTPDGY